MITDVYLLVNTSVPYICVIMGECCMSVCVGGWVGGCICRGRGAEVCSDWVLSKEKILDV